MTIEQMREEIIKAYPEPGWRNKVSEWRDQQVFAAYKNMERNGTFAKRAKINRENGKMKETGRQITIFDLLKEGNEDIYGTNDSDSQR